MKLYKGEIQVAERDDMTYEVEQYAGKFFALVHFRGFHWDTFKVGNKKGYKTERGALNAIKTDAARKRSWAPNGATLVF